MRFEVPDKFVFHSWNGSGQKLSQGIVTPAIHVDMVKNELESPDTCEDCQTML